MARLPAVESPAQRRSLSDRFTRGAEADAQAWSWLEGGDHWEIGWKGRGPARAQRRT